MSWLNERYSDGQGGHPTFGQGLAAALVALLVFLFFEGVWPMTLLWKIPLVIVGFSFGEWLMHKYVLHGRWVKYSYRHHAIQHHAEGRNDLRPHIDLVLADYVIMFPFIAQAVYRGVWDGVFAQVLVMLVHWVFWNKIHRAIHGVETNWTQRLPFYGYFKRHHELHHKNVRCNLNVVFPIADYILGTKR